MASLPALLALMDALGGELLLRRMWAERIGGAGLCPSGNFPRRGPFNYDAAAAVINE
nr:hypothetical protein [uncultured Sphingomonas sp.]